MRLVLQRVSEAWVIVNEKKTSHIQQGWLILLGIGAGDQEEQIKPLCQKIAKLRAFSDESGKMNLSIQDIKAEILLVSQFTLYGDFKKGNRPSFTSAASPDLARNLYEKFIFELNELKIKTATGVFAADMKVGMIGDGPVTFYWDI